MNSFFILRFAWIVLTVTGAVLEGSNYAAKISNLECPFCLYRTRDSIESFGGPNDIVKRSSNAFLDESGIQLDDEKERVKRESERRRRGSDRPRSASSNSIESGQIIRLRGGSRSLEGRVEVFVGGRWGSVCDDAWGFEDAHVACRQLGYDRGAEEATVGGVFGPANGDILMDNVQCFGFESSLQNCQHIPASGHDCSVNETAGLICLPNEGCEDGWFGVHGLCYKFIETPANFRNAIDECSSPRHGARLAIVDSQQENDFLSEWLKTNTASGSWFIGGKKKGGRRNTEWNWVDSYRPRMRFNNWLPGSGLARNERCLVLQDKSRDDNNELDYYYWNSANCGIARSFICQKVAASSDCYEGNGENYRGRVSRTEDGTLCENWTGASNVNPTTHPSAGLGDHNFCRNPDSDQRPWCYTDSKNRKYLYCAVKPCPVSDSNQPSGV